jgi:hypothetical protein
VGQGGDKSHAPFPEQKLELGGLGWLGLGLWCWSLSDYLGSRQSAGATCLPRRALRRGSPPGGSSSRGALLRKNRLLAPSQLSRQRVWAWGTRSGRQQPATATWFCNQGPSGYVEPRTGLYKISNVVRVSEPMAKANGGSQWREPLAGATGDSNGRGITNSEQAASGVNCSGETDDLRCSAFLAERLHGLASLESLLMAGVVGC